MSIYRKADGSELVICDGCGIAADGTRPDVNRLEKVDLTAWMLAVGFPAGTKLNVEDHCPDCNHASSAKGAQAPTAPAPSGAADDAAPRSEAAVEPSPLASPKQEIGEAGG